MSLRKGHLTELLDAWQRGESGADSDIFTAAYDELRRQAARFMRRERPGHTLQATAIVHEAWLQIRKSPTLKFKNSSDFFAVAATIMRRILIEHARKHNRIRHGGGFVAITLNDDIVADPKERGLDILALDEALSRFEKFDPKRSKIIEHRYFSGLSIEMTAKALGRSVSSVNKDWFIAKAWLYNELSKS